MGEMPVRPRYCKWAKWFSGLVARVFFYFLSLLVTLFQKKSSSSYRLYSMRVLLKVSEKDFLNKNRKRQYNKSMELKIFLKNANVK